MQTNRAVVLTALLTVLGTVVLATRAHAAADPSCTVESHRKAWTPWWTTRIQDANCSCEFYARTVSCVASSDGGHQTSDPILRYVLSVPGGCKVSTCEHLPGYQDTVKRLAADQVPGLGVQGGYQCADKFTDADQDGIPSCLDTDDHNAVLGLKETTLPPVALRSDVNIGFPPWSCGGFSTGDFFITCDDAFALKQTVYCSLDCGCQADYEHLFDSQCPENYPAWGTQCGTTCVCWGTDNINPFADNCDCSSGSESCQGSEPVPADTMSDDDYSGGGHAGCSWTLDVGVSPGKKRYAPSNCKQNPGPPPPQTGTTGSGQYAAPSGRGTVSRPCEGCGPGIIPPTDPTGAAGGAGTSRRNAHEPMTAGSGR